MNSSVQSIPPHTPAADPALWRLTLLGAWGLADPHGTSLSLPRRATGLISILAIRGETQRSVMAGTLWPDSSEAHALTSLRTTVAMVQREAPGLLRITDQGLDLTPELSCDFTELLELIAASATMSAEEMSTLATQLVAPAELLPGVYADWVLAPRDHLLVARLTALNRGAEVLRDAGLLPTALLWALTAAELDPLAEFAHRLVASIHLMRGDRVKAYVAYEEFRKRSIREFGLGPSQQFQEIVGPLVDERASRQQGQRIQRRRRSPPR